MIRFILLPETAMILPGKYAVQSMRRGRKYEVRANLKSFLEKPETKKLVPMQSDFNFARFCDTIRERELIT